ncbi:MAG: hypothetical protein U1D30_09395 [Planctomycetota bacterium]
MRSIGLLAITLLVVLANASRGADLETLLGRSLIEPELSMKQAQVFTKSRIAKWPPLTTAEAWMEYADGLRQRIFNEVIFRGEAAEWKKGETKVEWLDTIEGGPGYKLRKLRYEVVPGLWIPALLYRPDRLEGKVPVVLNVNGHDGDGKQAPYKQIRCINQAKKGMLALNVEWFNMGQLAQENFNHYRLNQMDLCGTSGVAPFLLAMQRGLDILLSLPNADPSRVAVAGLSGGGWQTITVSSLDTRVTLADPVAGYSSWHSNVMNGDLGDSEQSPSDLAAIADYAHLTAMRAPRPTLLTYNYSDNCCFKAENALPPLLEAARPVYRLVGKEDHLRWHVNFDPGDHNFQKDNRVALYYMFRDFFYPGDPSFDPQEIPSDGEVKSKQDLFVELPADNLDFHKIAMNLSEGLPRNPELPTSEPEAKAWQQSRRERLAKLVRYADYSVKAQEMGVESFGAHQARSLRLHLGDDWTVPAVEIGPAGATTTTVVVADQGRKSTAAVVEKLLATGQRVLAVDPYNFGESKIVKTPMLFDLFMASVGERPIGVQASQLAAIARWRAALDNGQPVTLVAVGPRCSVFSLIAGGLETRAIGGVQLQESMGSLREVIERNWTIPESAEQFCFGLLAEFDVLQLGALVVPRPLQLIEPSERCKRELAPLQAFYQLLGENFEPLARQ